MKFLSPCSNNAYAALHFIAGSMFAFHGAQKILGLLTEKPMPEMWTQFWFGGMIELIAGILIAFGLFTRFFAFLASGTMAVAYFQFHWKFAFDKTFFPIVNQGELAALYCFVFLYIACRGGVKWCIDKD